MGNSQSKIRVFMIHRWEMSNWQESLSKLLTQSGNIEIVDKSYSIKNPAEKSDFIQDYACGQMLDSDIIIVLPPSDNDFIPISPHINAEDDYLPFFSSQPFARNHGIDPKSVYITELKTLMYDSCNHVPVLVLGWYKDCADHLANILRKPDGHINGYDPSRVHAMSIECIGNTDYLINKIKKIIEKRVAFKSK